MDERDEEDRGMEQRVAPAVGIADGGVVARADRREWEQDRVARGPTRVSGCRASRHPLVARKRAASNPLVLLGKGPAGRSGPFSRASQLRRNGGISPRFPRDICESARKSTVSAVPHARLPRSHKPQLEE